MKSESPRRRTKIDLKARLGKTTQMGMPPPESTQSKQELLPGARREKVLLSALVAEHEAQVVRAKQEKSEAEANARTEALRARKADENARAEVLKAREAEKRARKARRVQVSLARAKHIFEFVELLVPRRICDEELGDATEQIGFMVKEGRSPWQIYLKVATTIFWVLLNAFRSSGQRVAMREVVKKRS